MKNGTCLYIFIFEIFIFEICLLAYASLADFSSKKKYISGLDPGCEPKPKTKINSEFNSIHFGIEINKRLKFIFF